MKKRKVVLFSLLLSLMICLSMMLGVSSAQAQITGGTPNPELPAAEDLAFNSDTTPRAFSGRKRFTIRT